LSENKVINLHFAHANGFPAGSYRQVFEALPQHFNLHALSQFGHNPAFPVNKNLSNLVKELLEYLGNNINSPVYGVGHSMGALVTYMAACEAPELFKGVIMLDPPIASGLVSWLFKLAKLTSWIDKVSPAGKAAMRCKSWSLDSDLVAYFSAKSLFENFSTSSINDYVKAAIKIEGGRQVLTFDAEIEAQIFRNVCDNIHKYYGKMQCPSCLITAENSQVCVPSYLNHFIKNTQIEHIQIPSLGHMFPLEAPRDAANLITQKITLWEAENKKG
jgi:pimeloyl-ACP methyl ester carboxylesterase